MRAGGEVREVWAPAQVGCARRLRHYSLLGRRAVCADAPQLRVVRNALPPPGTGGLRSVFDSVCGSRWRSRRRKDAPTCVCLVSPIRVLSSRWHPSRRDPEPPPARGRRATQWRQSDIVERRAWLCQPGSPRSDTSGRSGGCPTLDRNARSGRRPGERAGQLRGSLIQKEQTQS